MEDLVIEYQSQNGRWHRYQQLHNSQDAFRVASRRAQSTGKRHRIVDDNKNLVDIIDPWRSAEKAHLLMHLLHNQLTGVIWYCESDWLELWPTGN